MVFYYIFQQKEYQIRNLREKLHRLIYKLRYFSSKNALKFFVWIFPGYHQEFFRKILFHQTYTNDMSIDSVFDGDYESAIIFCENMYMKNENCKIRAHFGM